MKRKDDYQVAESIKKPMIGQLAFSTELQAISMYDGDKWVAVKMPIFVYSLSDLNPEKYQELLEWIKFNAPFADPQKIASMISVSVDALDVMKAANTVNNSILPFLAGDE